MSDTPETVKQIPPADVIFLASEQASDLPNNELWTRAELRDFIIEAIMLDRSRRPSSKAGKGEALPTVERVVSGDSHYMCFKNYPRGAWSLEIPKDVQDFFEEWAARNAALQPGHKP